MAPVWFITAASSGFGHEMALDALSRGHTVIATARSTSRVEDLREAGAHTLAFDVTAPLSDIQSIAKDVYARHGRVDYLINAAGYILDAAIEEASPQEVYDQFNTNVFGIVNTIKAFLPHMRAQDISTDIPGVRGTVVGFGSMASWTSGASYSLYSMTKWSCSALMEGLAEELEPFAIRSTVIEPGYFRTSFLRAGAKVEAQRIDAYDDETTPSGKMRKLLREVNLKQPGDVVKGSKVANDVLLRTGVAEGKTLPLRIVLGSDCEQGIRSKISGTLSILDEWSDVIRSTDYPEGK